ncbi:MAG: 8-oxo-dGTP diphosphatase [Erysipelotrichaceae bacterium]|jgi:8-oxo-dGTP diphosphatase|nr:8-oxo-dGTP diphosphatase [Erysipelotrichaceae bacterium]
MKDSTCIYLIQNHQVLMLYRNKKQNDVNVGKYIGIGGKRKNGESMLECAKREMYEETGLTADKLDYRGVVYFRYPHLEEERIYIYTSSLYHGEMHDCDEGTLRWVNESDVLSLPLWEGDKVFLKKMMKKETEPFHITLTYDAQDRLVSVEEGA